MDISEVVSYFNQMLEFLSVALSILLHCKCILVLSKKYITYYSDMWILHNTQSYTMYVNYICYTWSI